VAILESALLVVIRAFTLVITSQHFLPYISSKIACQPKKPQSEIDFKRRAVASALLTKRQVFGKTPDLFALLLLQGSKLVLASGTTGSSSPFRGAAGSLFQSRERRLPINLLDF